jgi:methionyl-tRNA formyltransferase
VQWAIREGDAVSGVSVIHMTPALDAGAVIVARAAPVYPGDTAVDLERLLSELGVDATLEAIDRLLVEIFAGQRPLRVFRQMKMYNDPTMNPYLYKADMAGTKSAA